MFPKYILIILNKKFGKKIRWHKRHIYMCNQEDRDN
jgi:hypothetical protein